MIAPGKISIFFLLCFKILIVPYNTLMIMPMIFRSNYNKKSFRLHAISTISEEKSNVQFIAHGTRRVGLRLSLWWIYENEVVCALISSSSPEKRNKIHHRIYIWGNRNFDKLLLSRFISHIQLPNTEDEKKIINLTIEIHFHISFSLPAITSLLTGCLVITFDE